MNRMITLMHKDAPVCAFSMNQSRQVENVLEIYHKELLPPTISMKEGRALCMEMTRWLKMRVYSPNRPDMKDIYPYIRKDNFHMLGKTSFYDKYWLKTNKKETWDSVDPYRNWSHKKDPICLLSLLPEYIHKDTDFVTPNLSIPGSEVKFFFRAKNGIVLLSQNILPEMNFYKKNKENPIVATRRCVTLGEHLFLAKRVDVDEQTEAFPLSDLYTGVNGFVPETPQGLYRCMETFGISRNETQCFIHEVCMADEKAGFEDRELSSLSLLRNADTLKITGFAKI